MAYNVYYILKKECLGYPIGTKIRVHDWSGGDWVQISIGGCLEWITTKEFDNITRSD